MVVLEKLSAANEQLDQPLRAKGIPLMRTRVQTKNLPTPSISVSRNSTTRSSSKDIASAATPLATCGTNASKLKPSTITRVPSAKSRVRKLCTTSSSSSSSSSSTISLTSGNNRNNMNDTNTPYAKQSAITRAATRIAVPKQVYKAVSSRLEGNALARNINSTQNCPPISRLVVPKVIKSSVLPRLVKKPNSNDSSINANGDHIRRDHDGNERNASSLQRCKNDKNICKTSSKTCEPKEKSIIPRNPLGSAKAVSSGRSITARGLSEKVRPGFLCGRSSNLVAVVRPQQHAFSTKIAQSNLSCEQENGKQEIPSSNSNKFANLRKTTTSRLTSLQNRRELKKEEEKEVAFVADKEKANSFHKDVNGSTTKSGIEVGASNNREHSSISKQKWPHEGQDGGSDHEDECVRESKQDDGPSERDYASAEKKRLVTTNTSGQEGTNSARLRASSSSAACCTPVVVQPCTPDEESSPSFALSSSVNELARGIESTENDKNDQFVSTNRFQTASSSNNGDSNDDYKKQRGYGAQTSKHSPGHIRSVSQSNTRMPKTKLQQQKELSNCYSSRRNMSINLQLQKRSSSLKLVQSTTINSNTPSGNKNYTVTELRAANDTALSNSNARRSIDRLLPKPIGQQVLSLMMLDAGLLPAGNNQPSTVVEKSHVCLQNESMVGCSEHELEKVSYLSSECLDTLASCKYDGNNDYDANNNIKSYQSDAPSKSNARTLIDAPAASLATSNPNGESQCSLADGLQRSSCNNLFKVRPSRKDLNYIKLTGLDHDISTERQSAQRRVDKNNPSITSLSLPSSPRPTRARERANGNWISAGSSDDTHISASSKVESVLKDNLDYLHADSMHRVGISESYQQAIARWLSPVRLQSQSNRSNVSKASFHCDINLSAGNHSISSSSCSSLNHNYPPPLALSNQLNGLGVHGLMEADVDEPAQTIHYREEKQKQHGNDMVGGAQSIAPQSPGGKAQPGHRVHLMDRSISSMLHKRWKERQQSSETEFNFTDDPSGGIDRPDASKKHNNEKSFTSNYMSEKEVSVQGDVYSESCSELKTGAVAANHDKQRYFCSDGEGNDRGSHLRSLVSDSSGDMS